MLSAFLRLPPRVTLVIILAALGFVIYHLATAGRVQPLWIVVALVLAIALTRTLWRLWQARRAKGTASDAPPAIVADSSASVALDRNLQHDPAWHDPAWHDPAWHDPVGAVPVARPPAPLHVEGTLTPPAVTFDGISKAYGAVRALRDVSFTIPQGQVVALLGPNGAGKTTALSIMLGLRRPSQGQARLLGLDPHDRHARSRCGIMLQESGAPLSLTVHETISLFRTYYPYPLPLARVVAMAGLEEKAHARVGALSGGQRQRLYFALAVCGDPDVLCLDEPTAGLDVEARHSVWEQIRAFVRQGKTIVLTTHYLEEADALAEHVILIDHGQVVADASPAALKAQVSSHRVSFQVSAPLPAAFLERLPIQQVEVSGRRVSFLTPQLEPALRAIFAQPVEIGDLAVSGASLEEAVLRLTQPVPAAKGA
jgi:ABC-2 type transport system ATP-binding protein